VSRIHPRFGYSNAALTHAGDAVQPITHNCGMFVILMFTSE